MSDFNTLFPKDYYSQGVNYGPISYSYLYIIGEEPDYDGAPEFYAKIGKTLQNLSERLRMLQQGNPRKLVIRHLYAGPSVEIDRLEAEIKTIINQSPVAGCKEWGDYTPSKLNNLVNRRKSDSIMQIKNQKIMPYPHTRYGKCYVYQNGLSPRDVIKEEWNLTSK